MGEKINEDFFKRNPEFLENIKRPIASFEAIEIFEIIQDNPYTINRNVGMGLDIPLAPDMVKISEIGKQEGLDLYPYKEYFKLYINMQRKQEDKQKKQQEETKK